MKLNLMELLYALSEALDMVEHDMIGVQSSHGKHVAYVTYLMADHLGMKGKELEEFVGCALLHDNAFSDYASEEFYGGSAVDSAELRKRVEMLTGDEYMNFISGSRHSISGEENIRLLPFTTDIENAVLYHHENADGTGPMGKTASETTLKSQIIHVADAIDVTWNLLSLSENGYNAMKKCVHEKSGSFFSKESASLFESAVTYEKLKMLQCCGSEELLKSVLPSETEEYTHEQIKNIAAFFAGIVDCKSSFVRNHSLGVADKAERMAGFYGFPEDKLTRIYLAGALHDIGKLIIENDVLEKNGRLTESEFAHVKNHAAATYRVLSKVSGLEDITQWASRHHEKLDGSGYPLGLTAEQLSFEDRLMTCSDIYQALTEPRPYKDAYPHEKAISIMSKMADDNQLDRRIVNDMDKVYGNI